jgi:NitT/TauT family transport system permease protein
MKSFGPTALLTAVLLLAWELLVHLFDVQSFVLPAPSSIAQTLVHQQALLLGAAGTTAVEVSVGFLLSTLVGIAVAIVIERFAVFGRALYPLVVLFQTVPKVALAPIIVLWFGYALTAKVVLIVAIAFFPVTLDMLAGMHSVDRSLIALMRSVGASRGEILWRVQVPASLPHLLSGLKIAITLSVIGAIVGEFAGASGGLGYVIQFASSQLDAPLVFAALVEISVLGLAFYYLIEALEHRAAPWAPKFDRTHHAGAT